MSLPTIRLPRNMPLCLRVDLVSGDQSIPKIIHQNGAPLPFQQSELFELVFEKRRQLCKGADVRAAYEITFSRSTNAPSNFEPGEAIGIICPNVGSEVERMLKQLNFKGDEVIRVSSLDNERAQKRFKQFSFIPEECTVRQLFTSILDLRTVLKKAFLRDLGDSCPAGSDDQKLLHGLSSSMRDEYRKDVLESRMMIFDLLERYPSCVPGLDVLIENLARLSPRFYSIANYSSENVKIIYKPMEFESQGARLLGQCSDFFETLSSQTQPNGDDLTGVSHERSNARSSLTEMMHNIQLEDDQKQMKSIQCFVRKNVRNFRFPDDISTPFVFICHGTGVSPFESFLDFVENKHPTAKLNASIYYGCRYIDQDNLLSVDKSRKLGVQVILKQSRSDPDRGYVQCALAEHSQAIKDLVATENSQILICGDYQTMVQETLSQLTLILSDDVVSELNDSKRIKIDVWT